MTFNIHIDFETRSEVELSKCGVGVYSRHPSTVILCMAYKINGEQTQIIPFNYETKSIDLVEFSKFIKSTITAMHHSKVRLHAHNAQFERVMMMNCASRMLPGLDIEMFGCPRRWVCTMVKAYACGMPGRLDLVGKLLGVGHKLEAGKRIMMKMCKPRRATKNDDSKWHENEDDFNILYEYCIQDVELEYLIGKQLPSLNRFEKTLWNVDQMMNDKGVVIDRELIDKLLVFYDNLSEQLTEELKTITEGEINSVGEVGKLKDWLNERGLNIESVNKATVEELLTRDLPRDVHRVLSIRSILGKSSVKKLQTALKLAPDGVVRYMFQFNGAMTGRWSGRGLQLHNLPRGKVENPGAVCQRILKGDYSDLEVPNPNDVISGLIRSVLMAPEGKKFCVADYSAIEARVLFWVANESKGLQQYRDDLDIYVEMAKEIYRNPELTKANKAERQLGKAAILGCLSAGTPICSDTGMIPIDELKGDERIWDGEKWVNYLAVEPVGKKNVISLGGIELTLDHLVLTNQGWRTAEEIVLNGGTQLLNTRRDLVSGQLFPRMSLRKVQNVVSLSAAIAVMNKLRESISCGSEKVKAVFDALIPEMAGEVGNQVYIMMSYLILGCEKDGQSVGETLRHVVGTQRIKTTATTANVVSLYPLGRAKSSWNILLSYLGTMSGDSPSIELIIPKDMNPETLELLLKKKTTEIKDDLITNTECYDIIGCPDNRFQAGELIVHNCGYGMGGPRFEETCKMMGIEIEEGRGREIVNVYRRVYKAVPNFWYAQESAAKAAINVPLTIVRAGAVAWVYDEDSKRLGCRLPSGRYIRYFNPRIVQDRLEYQTQIGNATTLMYKSIWGGLITENICQAIARDVLAQAIINCSVEGLDTRLHVHDELGIYADKEDENALDDLINNMIKLPEWATGLPLVAEGWEGDRYKK